MGEDGSMNGWRAWCLAVALPATFLVPAAGQAQPVARRIELGEARIVRSAILDEDRELQIVLPESYSRTTISYPVLFLLDGSSHLLHAAATVRFLAGARNRIPEMIVVAVPNRNRNRDMTPGPGAVTFQRVLAEEIIPWVERNYRAAPERIVSGHSLSASFAIHTMLNRPELFDAYVAASAPVWRYANFADEVKTGLPRAAKLGTAVYLAVGEHENDQLRGGMKSFAALLAAAPPPTVPAWTFADMKDEDHSSTPQRTLYTALETRYGGWRFPFFENPEELEKAGGLRGLEDHYRRFSQRFGYASPPPEARLQQIASIYLAGARHDDLLQLASAYAAHYPTLSEGVVNQVGYDLLKRGDVERALTAFKRNATSHPASPNVHDSLGDAYCRAGDREAALRSYREAARAAETRAPDHPRLPFYRAKIEKGCSG
jgi:uncharacterized protein